MLGYFTVNINNTQVPHLHTAATAHDHHSIALAKGVLLSTGKQNILELSNFKEQDLTFTDSQGRYCLYQKKYVT